MVSGRDHNPYVTITLGTQKAQLETDKAMDVAFHIMECAEAAISDAFLHRFMTQDGEGVDPKEREEQAVALIMHLREYRKKFPIARGWFPL